MRYLLLPLVFLLVTPVAYADTSLPVSKNVPIPRTFEALEAAAVRAKVTHCGTDDCKSMILLDYLVRNAALYEAGDANGIASITGRNRLVRAGKRLDAHLLAHPELYPRMCTFFVKYLDIVASGNETYDSLYASMVPAQIFLSAVDMDLLSGGHCAEKISPFYRRKIERANTDYVTRLCIGGFENHNRPESACNIIKRNALPDEQISRP